MPVTALGVLSYIPYLHYFSVETIKHHTTNRLIRWIIWLNTVAVKSRILFKNIYEDSVLVKRILDNVDDISRTIKNITHDSGNEDMHQKSKDTENVWINMIEYSYDNNTVEYYDNYNFLSLKNNRENGEVDDTVLHELVNLYYDFKEEVFNQYHCIEDADRDADKNADKNADKSADKNTDKDEETLSNMSPLEEEEEQKENDGTYSENSDAKSSDGGSTLDGFTTIIRYYNKKVIRNARIYKKNGITPIDDVAPITFHSSNVKFITVEYMDENSEDAFELHLPKEYYIEGNHLFTPVFISMLLKTQHNREIYDFNYKLFIIDNNANMFQINSSKYILLEENDYKVLDL